MKKTYLIPQTMVMGAEPTTILAASQFNTTDDTQTITFTDEEYDGEFSVKEDGFLWDE